ncbi:uncharacterized protein LOC144744907 [Ciona intestinalis]
MEDVKLAADGGNDDHQLNCYGLVFPDNCDTYYGPHSVQCLTTIWEWKGCLNEGTRAPVKLDHADKEAVDLLTVDEVLENFELVQVEAHGSDKDKGLECYGIVFPDNCDTYYGPHSVECLTTIWEWKGCLGEGTKAPVKLDHIELHDVDVINISGILQNFEAIRVEANGGDDGSQLECYGLGNFLFLYLCVMNQLFCIIKFYWLNQCISTTRTIYKNKFRQQQYNPMK